MPSLFRRLNLDPYLLLLLCTVALASVLPPRGDFAPFMEHVADAGIVFLFFLHGAKLSRQAIVEGISNWRLHGVTLGLTYVLFPLLGLVISVLPGLEPSLATGLLFVTLLPSTVQSSIAFVALARGNVAAAVCSASFSNLAGIFVTPLLAALLMGGQMGGLSFDSVKSIALQLLLPFVIGHLMRPLIGAWVTKHKWLVSKVDRGSILLVVYSAFGNAVADGLWSRVSIGQLATIIGISLVVLVIVLSVSRWLGMKLGFPREDWIVLQFCGSKKSLATGVPMAGVLFPAAQVGGAILPLLFFHQLQLMICAVLARRYAAQADAADAG